MDLDHLASEVDEALVEGHEARVVFVHFVEDFNFPLFLLAVREFLVLGLLAEEHLREAV